MKPTDAELYLATLKTLGFERSGNVLQRLQPFQYALRADSGLTYVYLRDVGGNHSWFTFRTEDGKFVGHGSDD